MKHRSGAPLLIAVALVANGLAQSAHAQTSDPIAQAYASDFGVSVDEAARRLSYTEQAAELQARLIREEPLRFSGLYIDNGPEFRIVVKFMGDASALLSRFTTDPTYVAQRSRLPIQALQRAQQTLQQTLGADARIAMEVDPISETVKVWLPNPERARAALSRLGIPADAVDIRQSQEFYRTVATVRGGNRVEHGTEIGTLGFNVQNAAGTRGVVTAAHFGECTGQTRCTVNGPASTSPSGVSLIHQGQQNAGGNDYEWRTAAGHTFPNEIAYANTSMTITAVADPLTFPVGTTVCKQGNATGYTCGTIQGLNSTTYNGVSGTYIRVARNGGGDMVRPGDSGGPVFGANTAYGIVHSQVITSGMQGQMLFMPIQRISGLGLNVLTAP